MRAQHVRYNEGQWFAVPVDDGGYVLGIIVRGSYKTKGGLGYFFGPKLSELPGNEATWVAQPADALLIRWFGDLHIITGRWPLVASTRPFRRQDWPVPRFWRDDPLKDGYGWITEYSQDDSGLQEWLREVRCPVEQGADLPEDGLAGARSIEIHVSGLLRGRVFPRGYRRTPKRDA